MLTDAARPSTKNLTHPRPTFSSFQRAALGFKEARRPRTRAIPETHTRQKAVVMTTEMPRFHPILQDLSFTLRSDFTA